MPLLSCDTFWPENNASHKICSGVDVSHWRKIFNIDRPSLCPGDSGGPLVCPVKEDASVWLLFGINASAAFPCGIGPAMQTQVAAYLDWIQQEISKK